MHAEGFVGLAARQKKSLSGKLDQALPLQSLLSQDKKGWGVLSDVFSWDCPFAWALSWENALTQHYTHHYQADIGILR